MGSTDHLYFQWNEYESNFKQGFSDLRQNEELFDVTLISGSKILKAHKVILSACSPVFRSIIGSAPFQTHPLIYLRGINFDHLELLLSFMYHGEVRVIQEELEDFISSAEELQIKGLSRKLQPSVDRSSIIPTASTSFSTCSSQDQVQVPLHDSIDVPSLKKEESVSLPKSLPNTPNEDLDKEYYTLNESNKSNIAQSDTQNESVQMDIQASIASNFVSCDPPDESEELDIEASSDSNFILCNFQGKSDGTVIEASSSSNIITVDAPNKPVGLEIQRSIDISSDRNNEYVQALDTEIERYYHRLKSKKGYECEKCGYTCPNPSKMRVHIEGKHIITKRFFCKLCCKTYKTRNSLRCHNYYIHKNGSVLRRLGLTGKKSKCFQSCESD